MFKLVKGERYREGDKKGPSNSKYMNKFFAKSKILTTLFLLFMISFSGLASGFLGNDNSNSVNNYVAAQQVSTRATTRVINSFEGVAQYIRSYGRLPDNFITKSQAQKLGWVSSKGNLAQVAPGKSIGGDVFRNSEGKLPSKSGRVWREADINYVSGFRNSNRILYSNDGLIYKTTDHYNSFSRMY